MPSGESHGSGFSSPHAIVQSGDSSGRPAIRSFARLSGASEGVRAEPAEATRVITVLSPKGGTGKTTMATNLAIGLGRVHPGRVVLVDLDVQFGDVGAALGLTPEQGMADVARAPSNLDATMLKVFLTPHPAGIFALCAPDTPAEADYISAAHSASAIELLASQFAFVVARSSDSWRMRRAASSRSSSDKCVSL